MPLGDVYTTPERDNRWRDYEQTEFLASIPAIPDRGMQHPHEDPAPALDGDSPVGYLLTDWPDGGISGVRDAWPGIVPDGVEPELDLPYLPWETPGPE